MIDIDYFMDRDPRIKTRKIEQLLNSDELSEREKRLCRQVLAWANVPIAYDWINHRGETFFPTYEDCLREEDWEFQCMD